MTYFCVITPILLLPLINCKHFIDKLAILKIFLIVMTLERTKLKNSKTKRLEKFNNL